MKIRAIAFDCFGVLLNDYGHNWVESSGLPADIQAEVHALFRKRDLGEIDNVAYYAAIQELAGIEPAVMEAREYGVQPIDPMLLHYIKNTLASRYELYIASNASASLLEDLLKKDGFTGIFAHIFVSSKMGVIKPEPGFYQSLLQNVSISASEILFVDDRKPNVDAAITAGMQGYHYCHGFASFNEYLRRL